MSHVTFHMSAVTCHGSQKKYVYGQSGETSWLRVCYQRGYLSNFERPGSLGADSLKIHAIVIVNHELAEGAPIDYNISFGGANQCCFCLQQCNAWKSALFYSKW